MSTAAKVTAAVAVLALAALPEAAAGKVSHKVKGPGFSFKMKGVVGRWIPEAKAKPTYEYYLVEKDPADKKATKGDGRKNAARMTQSEARRQCEAMGASLPSIHSADEHRQLIALLDGNKHGFWVGAERDAARAKNMRDEQDEYAPGYYFEEYLGVSRYGVDTDNDNDAFDLELAPFVQGVNDEQLEDYHNFLDTYAAMLDTLLPGDAPTGHGAKDKWANLDGTAWNYDNWAPGEPSQDIDNFVDAFVYKRENCVYSGGGSRKNNGNPSLFYDGACRSDTDGTVVSSLRMKVICKREIDPPDVSHFYQQSFTAAVGAFGSDSKYRRSAMLLNDVAAGATSIEFGPIALPKVQIGDLFIFMNINPLDEEPIMSRSRRFHEGEEEVFITGLDPVTFQPPLSNGRMALSWIAQNRRVRCSTSDDCSKHGFCFSSACWDTSRGINADLTPSECQGPQCPFNVCDIVTSTFGNTDDGWAQADLQSTDPNWLCTAEPTTTVVTTTIPAPLCAFPGFIKSDKRHRGGKRNAILKKLDADDAEQCYNECLAWTSLESKAWTQTDEECTHFAYSSRRSLCILYRGEPTSKTRMKHMYAYLPSSTCQDAFDAFDAFAATSDRRLKENIARTGVSPSGIPIFEFNYIANYTSDLAGNRFSGTMAQDLLALGRSDAVILRADGYYAVDYARLDVDFIAV